LPGLRGGLVGSTVAAPYVVHLGREDVLPRERVRGAVSASMLIATGATGLAGAVWPRACGRAALLSAVGAAVIVWGVIGIFSVGLPLLIAAIPT